ncbi:MAG: hypothetical protein M3Y80_03670, partial [Verrucomicrobiota bacterium]|nr:hypothetical protein [Verrucomicrobiota bacterium]
PAVIAAAGLCVFALSGCTTTQTRIAEKSATFQRLSPADQARVQQGEIREGMPEDAVYIAWVAQSLREPGRNRGQTVDTWIYYATAAGDYPGPFYFGGGYGYGLGGYGYGIGGGYGGGYYGGHRGRFYRHPYYSPFYDPFFYNHANIVRYPERTVSFANGRVIAWQLLPAPRFF